MGVWLSRDLTLAARPRGFHLVTGEVLEALPEVRDLSVGLLHLHLRHTSAALTLNENASPDVRDDFATWFDRAVPDGAPYWTHTLEGPDDMPSHVRAALTQPPLPVPTLGGRPSRGTWQGLCVCERRHQGHTRRVVAHYLGT